MNFSAITKASRFKNVSLFLFYIALISICILQTGCDNKSDRTKEPIQLLPSYVFSGKTMGTYYTVKMIVPEGFSISHADIQQRIDNKLLEINNALSTYIPDSELSVFNRLEANKKVKLSDELFYMLSLSKKIHQQSGGAFDVTIGPLVNLWGFGVDKSVNKVPSEQSIAKAREKMGSSNIILHEDSTMATRATDLYIDLSAIAKGYGCDIIANMLKEQGISNFMVEIGGELVVQGVNDKNTKWVIGVEKPSLLNSGAVQAIHVSGVGVATSGDYRNYYERDGRRYSHTISPTTGKPITHNLASVTVIAPTAAEADAYATAINVLGHKEGYELATNLGLAAFFIIKNEQGFYTKHTETFANYLPD